MTFETSSEWLTPKETELVKELRELVSQQTIQEAIKRWLTDACLCRYLRARSWDVKKAGEMLKETIAWRTSFQPHTITWDQISNEAETGKMYISPNKDKLGRTVLIMRPGRENTTEHEGKIKYLVYCLEASVRTSLQTAEGVSGREGPGRGAESDLAPEQFCIVCDYEGWSLSSAPPMKTSVETLHILQNHYPERLGASIIINYPTLFSMFWTMISPFVDVETYKKIQFISHTSKSRDEKLSQLFDLEYLEEAVGGKSKYVFDFQEYGKSMKCLQEYAV
mmetsp:Transcript_28053/g.38784  ORF Transcript_28053/g.38784 Transcript_28053/m.38784 type:complete len:279 (-) Transcript_28053:96-932(-)